MRISIGSGRVVWHVQRHVLTGATAITGAAAKAIQDLRQGCFAWEERKLVFSVREPFPSKWSQASLVFGEVGPDKSLRVRSLMPEGGVIFSDGIESDTLEFRSGLEAAIELDARQGLLVR